MRNLAFLVTLALLTTLAFNAHANARLHQLFTDHIGGPDWRPRNTQDVAKRLSLWALKDEYGQKTRLAHFAASG